MFDGIQQKNVFSFNAMLIAYSLHGRPCQGLSIFARLASCDLNLKPDAYSISCVLKCLSSLCSSSSLPHQLGREIHGFVLGHGIGADLFVTNGLVTLYARSGDMDSARKIFDLMSEKDIISWNAMISGYDQGGHYEECLKLYEKLEGACGDLRPDCVTVVSVLHACSQVKDLTFGMRVHRSLGMHGIDIDMAVWNSIIGLYAKCGELESARRLFDEMMDKDEVTYGAMISGYMSLSLVGQAMELFRQIQNPHLTTWNAVISGLVQNNSHFDALAIFRELQNAGFRPNSVTLSSILPTVAFFSNLLAGKQIHGYAIKNDCDPNMYVVSAMIDMYSKAGFLHGAHRVFQHFSPRSVIVWTAIISAYAAHGDAGAALSLFWEMLSSGTRPDPVTFTAVLSACAHAGAVNQARLVFDSVMPEYGVRPWIEQYACMVGVLSRAGMLDEAVKLTQKMPEEPNAKVWGALLNGASIHGEVALGEYAFARLINIEPENTGNYVIMANLYTQARKLEEAEMVREKMRKMGLGKIPGCSWVETTDGLHAFVAQDTSSARSEELCVMLDGLDELMRENGYAYQAESEDETLDNG